jgi:hypothetical protein
MVVDIVIPCAATHERIALLVNCGARDTDALRASAVEDHSVITPIGDVAVVNPIGCVASPKRNVVNSGRKAIRRAIVQDKPPVAWLLRNADQAVLPTRFRSGIPRATEVDAVEYN